MLTLPIVALYLTFFVAGWLLGGLRRQGKPRRRPIGHHLPVEALRVTQPAVRGAGTLIGLHVSPTGRRGK
jgi:hypothetical protein